MLRKQWGLSEPFYDEDEVVGEHPYISAFHPLKDKDTYNSATEVNESSVRKAAIAAHYAMLSDAQKNSSRPTGPFVITGCNDDERTHEPRGQAATEEDAMDEEESEHAQAAADRRVEEEPTDDQETEKLQLLPEPEDKHEDDDINADNEEEDQDEKTRLGQDVVRSSAIIHNSAGNNSEVDEERDHVSDEGV